MNSSFTKVQHNFFILVFVGALVLLFYICRPFIAPLVMATAFAVVSYPLYKKILSITNGKKNLSAFISIAIILIVILIPLVFAGSLLFGEARHLYDTVATSSNVETLGIGKFFSTIEAKLQTIAPDISLDPARYIQAVLQWILSHLDAFFSGFIGIILGLFIMIVALFFLLRDGKIFREKLFLLSPFGRVYDENIFSKLALAVNSVIKGSLVISAVQGIFATIGFAAMGIPNPLIWGLAATLSSLIPGVGTSLVTIPCIIYLLVTAPLWQAVLLAIWAVCGIGLIDNFLAPLVLKYNMKIHPFLILISILGGIYLFGPIGFIVGPVALAFFFALLDIYPEIIRE